MRKNIEKYYTRNAKLSDLGYHFEAICMALSSGSASFCALLFGTSGGSPLGQMLAYPWAPLIRCCGLFESVEFILKAPGQQMAPTTPSNKTSKDSINTTNQSNICICMFGLPQICRPQRVSGLRCPYFLCSLLLAAACHRNV